jgi:TPR repeat protein
MANNADTLIVAGVLGSAWADWDDGVATYAAGDYAKAYRSWFPDAEQGDANAQFNLGIMYGKGEGVPEDYVKTYMWWLLAKAQGDKEAAGNLNIVKKRMNTAQIGKAQALASEWWENHN